MSKLEIVVYHMPAATNCDHKVHKHASVINKTVTDKTVTDKTVIDKPP
jgi:hypothetical protein